LDAGFGLRPLAGSQVLRQALEFHSCAYYLPIPGTGSHEIIASNRPFATRGKLRPRFIESRHVKGIAGSIQYKFIEIRDEQQHVVIVALTRHESLKNGFEVVFVARGPIENSEAVLRKTVDGFSKKENVQVEFVDLRDVKTLDEFKLRAAALGWRIQTQPQ
jgi:hypothetical protein